jgi:hypothetical protein
MFTNERATLSNGSLANSRIINATRSPQAWLYILLKFSVDVPYEKLQLFHSAVEQYIRNRPREWLSLNSFRATRVEADLGFIEYIVVVQHRESWASWGALMLSKAHLSSFSLELSRKLDIRFKSPPLPVDLSVVNHVNTMDPTALMNQDSTLSLSPGSATLTSLTADLASLQAKFMPVSS